MSELPLLFQNEFAEVEALLASNPKVGIVTHVGPDGDAIGSSLALHRILQSFNVASVIYYSDVIPDNLLWLFSSSDCYEFAVENEEETKSQFQELELLFTVDFSVKDRAGPIHEWIPSHIPIITFDHHVDREPFSQITIWNPHATSTAELVFYFAYYLERKGRLKFGSEIAYPLFVGMETDTGGFHFDTVNHLTFRIASYLVEKGVKPNEVFFHLYQNESVKRLKFLGYVLSHCFHYLPAYRCAYLKIALDDMIKWGVSRKDIEGFVFYPLNLSEVDLGIMIREDERGDVKMSFRSKRKFPANRIAHFFGGGGHLHAAGARIRGKTIDEVETELIRVLENYFNKTNHYEGIQV
jgi:phosphoesterase RecJ-like protein